VGIIGHNLHMQIDSKGSYPFIEQQQRTYLQRSKWQIGGKIMRLKYLLGLKCVNCPCPCLNWWGRAL